MAIVVIHILQSVDVNDNIVQVIRQRLLAHPFQIFFIYTSVWKACHHIDPCVLFFLNDAFCQFHPEPQKTDPQHKLENEKDYYIDYRCPGTVYRNDQIQHERVCQDHDHRIDRRNERKAKRHDHGKCHKNCRIYRFRDQRVGICDSQCPYKKEYCAYRICHPEQSVSVFNIPSCILVQSDIYDSCGQQ